MRFSRSANSSSLAATTPPPRLRTARSGRVVKARFIGAPLGVPEPLSAASRASMAPWRSAPVTSRPRGQVLRTTPVSRRPARVSGWRWRSRPRSTSSGSSRWYAQVGVGADRDPALAGQAGQLGRAR